MRNRPPCPVVRVWAALALLAVAVAVFQGCIGSPQPEPPTIRPDAGSVADAATARDSGWPASDAAGLPDAGADGGSMAPDGSLVDAGLPDGDVRDGDVRDGDLADAAVVDGAPWDGFATD